MTWQKTHLACAQLSSTYKLRDEWFVYNTEFLCREKQLNFYLYIHSHEKSMMEMKKCFFWLSLKIRKKCSSNWSNLVPLYTFTNEMVFLHAKFLQKCSLQVSTAQSASLLPWAIFSLEQNLITWLKRTEGAWGVKKKKGRWGLGNDLRAIICLVYIFTCTASICVISCLKPEIEPTIIPNSFLTRSVTHGLKGGSHCWKSDCLWCCQTWCIIIMHTNDKDRASHKSH